MRSAAASALDVPEGFVLLSQAAPLASDGLEVGLAAVAASGVDLPVRA